MAADEIHRLSQAVRQAYRRGEEDETLPPLVLNDGAGPVGRIAAGDSAIFYNIRGEREIELTRALTEPDFREFPVVPLGLNFVTMIEYRKGLPVQVAFPPEETIEETLSDTLSRHGLKQAKITEAEKAVHATYFLNGKRELPFPGEERIIVPTRKDVALFDAAPEMSSARITAAALEKIADRECPFLFVNLPNVDVVGHIENEAAILAAVACVDANAGRIVDAALAAGMTAIVSADHGTVEKWLYPDGHIDTGHTDSPVPFIVAGAAPGTTLREGGELADVAPTVLRLLGIPQPAAMTGRPLLDPPPGTTVPAGEAGGPRVLLLILDGWGWSESAAGNLIAQAQPPRFAALLKRWPHTTLLAAGESVGLPPGTVGNSEAGHLHIGAGRRVYSDRVKIDRAIADGTFLKNEAFLAAARAARDGGRALHLIGIVSFFSSHGSLNHLFALMDLARQEGVRELYIHAMLGRRGELPESGAHYIATIEERTAAIGLGRVVSVIGRYWSMDREENWDRIARTYRMLVQGEGTAVGGGHAAEEPA